MHLAADIGGTKGNFALVDRARGGHVLQEFTLASRDYGDFTAMVKDAVGRCSTRPETACFAVPGPVLDGAALMTTLDWRADEGALARDLGLKAVHLLNDLVATASGLPLLPAADLVTIHPGAARGAGPARHELRAVIAPGTGLGEAFCTWEGDRWHAHPAEGGHAGFAPRTAEQADLWAFLHQREGFVNVQSVCSGMGLANLWEWLTARGRGAEPTATTGAINAAPDPTREILGRAGESERCRLAIGHFVDILAGEATDLAVRMLPSGGLYLGGGLPPRLVERLTDGRFLRTWLSHPHLAHIHQAIAVHVVMNPKTALLGAIHHRA
jgi:glucokinase